MDAVFDPSRMIFGRGLTFYSFSEANGERRCIGPGFAGWQAGTLFSPCVRSFPKSFSIGERVSAPDDFTLYFAAVLGIGHGTHLQEWGTVILPDRIKVAFISEGENTANRAEFF